METDDRWVGGRLVEKRCVPCEGGVPKLNYKEAEKLLSELQAWQMNQEPSRIWKQFCFNNFYETMAFVNAVAWVANVEGHHPDLTVSYSSCRVEYFTHAIGGLSENDFICAAKIDALLN